MVIMTLFQIGAMFAGVAQVLNQLMPSISIEMWVPGLAGITLLLLLNGGYERVEKIATIKVGLFTMLTFMCAMMLLQKPEYFNWAQLQEGLAFKLPPQGSATVAVFGITGVGAAELFMYPYLCVEKGYARYTGPREAPGWQQRAQGWVAVMNLDIIASMAIYTVATVAFTAWRRRAPLPGIGPRFERHDPGFIQDVHADAGRLVGGFVLHRSHRHTLTDSSSPLPPPQAGLRRHGAAARRLSRR